MFPVINKKETGCNLRRIMDNCGLTVKDVQQYLGLGSVQSVYHWISGQSMPTIDNLYALSELFQVPIDVIVCGNRMSIPSVQNGSAYEARMYAYHERINGGQAA